MRRRIQHRHRGSTTQPPGNSGFELFLCLYHCDTCQLASTSAIPQYDEVAGEVALGQCSWFMHSLPGVTKWMSVVPSDQEITVILPQSVPTRNLHVFRTLRARFCHGTSKSDVEKWSVCTTANSIARTLVRDSDIDKNKCVEIHSVQCEDKGVYVCYATGCHSWISVVVVNPYRDRRQRTLFATDCVCFQRWTYTSQPMVLQLKTLARPSRFWSADVQGGL